MRVTVFVEDDKGLVTRHDWPNVRRWRILPKPTWADDASMKMKNIEVEITFRGDPAKPGTTEDGEFYRWAVVSRIPPYALEGGTRQ